MTQYLKPGIIFAITVLATTGPLLFSLLRVNSQDPLLGSHDPYKFSMDLLSPFIPGSHWYFADLTKAFWSRYPDMIHESSVYVGLSVLFICGLTWFKRHELPKGEISLWFSVFIVFLIMALGPTLHIWGNELPAIKLPYALFQWIFPPLEIAGMPIRMMVMTQLAAAVLVTYGVKLLIDKRQILSIILLLLALGVEFYPKPIPLTQMSIPEWVRVLKKQLHKGALIDFETPGITLPLYFQTHHEMPIASGYISRLPESVHQKFSQIRTLVRDEQFNTLSHELGFTYLLTKKNPRKMLRQSSSQLVHSQPPFNIFYQGKTFPIYETTVYLYKLR